MVPCCLRYLHNSGPKLFVHNCTLYTIPSSFQPRRVCCFVLLNRYWGIVTVPGSFLKQGTGGGRILTLRLNYVAGYTGPLLFLFERTHNCYVDNHGLVPWRLRRVDRSKVRSASLVRVLSDENGPSGTESQSLSNRAPPTT